ncbi:hypothetical protein GF319_06170 [Candidatus Bathyarchaeota archaeon]|nr:hypothetical protein [Candidatus Bathyarchaeota archaeon]
MDLLKFLLRLSEKRIVIFTTTLFFLTLAALPAIQEAGNIGSTGRSPDMSFTYSVEELYEMAESYGAEGRWEYILMRFTFDLVFPLIYGAFLVSVLGWLYKTKSLASWRRKVVILPFAGLVFDYLENLSTSIVMWRYPERTYSFGLLATLFTPIKWVLISLAFLALFPGLIVNIFDNKGSKIH